MNVDIRGAVTYQGSWSAFGQLRDVMDVDTNDLSLLGGQTLDVTRNLNLTLVFPGRLDVGTFAIGRYTPGVLPAGPAAYVEVDSLFFASLPGGSVTVASANYPPRPGLDFGMVNGTIVFRAVRLAAGQGGAPVATSDTVDIQISFAAHWYHYLRPNVTVSLSGGGPVLGTSLVTIAHRWTTIIADGSWTGSRISTWHPAREFPTRSQRSFGSPLQPQGHSHWLRRHRGIMRIRRAGPRPTRCCFTATIPASRSRPVARSP